jgi:hypothetical protein
MKEMEPILLLVTRYSLSSTSAKILVPMYGPQELQVHWFIPCDMLFFLKFLIRPQDSTILLEQLMKLGHEILINSLGTCIPTWVPNFFYRGPMWWFEFSLFNLDLRPKAWLPSHDRVHVLVIHP